MFDIKTPYDRVGQFFPWIAYDPDTHLHLLEDGYIGFGFTALPLSGFESSMEQRFNTLMTYEFPVGTFLQFNLCVFDDIGGHLEAIASARSQTKDPLIRAATVNTMRFLQEGAVKPGATDIPIRHAKMIITVKLPIEDQIPSDEETIDATRIRREILESLQSIGFHELRPLTDVELVHQTGIILNRNQSAGWRAGRAPLDEGSFLRDQILDYDTDVEISDRHVRLGDTYVTSLSIKKFPVRSFFGLGRSFSINPQHGQGGIPCSHMISGTVYYQDISEQRPKMEFRRQTVRRNAEGPFGKLQPAYKRRHEDLNLVNEAITQGDAIHKVMLNITLFNSSEDQASRNTTKARTYLSELGMTFLEDRMINWPLLQANLPFGSVKSHLHQLVRFRTMQSSGIATFLPLFFEWRGTRTPLVSLVGRGGQIMGYSPWDSSTNYNMTISAESGAGKSFFSNELIAAILAAGGKVWVIDVGRSYLKLCESLDGQFLHFGPDSDIVLNPFSNLNTEDEFFEVLDILTHLLSVMAAPTRGLDDFQEAMLRKIIQAQFAVHGNKLTIDHIAKAVMSEAHEQADKVSNEKRLSDIAHGLSAYCSTGQYGKYFDGPSNIDFNSNFVLLELEELKSQKHLQTIVLLLLIYSIQNGMYLGDRSQKKAMLVDEAWDLLSHDQIAKFIEAGYRRFRKYNGAACIITQSLLDLHGSKTGQAILANSSSTLMLRQKEATINRLAAGDDAEFSKSVANVMKTVHTAPGRYSEVFVRSPEGMGIGRLIVDPFRALLYSTNPDDVSSIKRYRDQGLEMKEAIEAVLEERGKALA